MVISIIGLILAIAFIMINEVFVFRKAKNIARAAFIMREDEEERLNSPKLLNNQEERIEGENNEISMVESRKDSETYIKERHGN